MIPARNGAWKRFGSVAVTQFQRSVCRNAANWRGGSKPLAARSAQAFFLEDQAVEFVVPEDVQSLPLGVVVGAGQSNEGGLTGSLTLDDFLDQPSPGSHLDEFTHSWRPVG